MLRSLNAHEHLKLDGLARDAFPVFLAHPGTIYFDSAATTQKPSAVIDAVNAYQRRAVNIGRSDYPWAVEVFHPFLALFAQDWPLAFASSDLSNNKYPLTRRNVIRLWMELLLFMRQGIKFYATVATA